MSENTNSLPLGRLSAIFLSVFLGACAGNQPPLATVDQVDLERFMGDWYVIANIPTFLEKGAHNAVESYELEPDGTIATTFVFRKDGFDGEEKTFHPKGVVTDTGMHTQLGLIAEDAGYVEASVRNVWFNLSLGAGLATLVMYLFLRSLRATAMGVIGIPICAIAAFPSSSATPKRTDAPSSTCVV